MSNILFEKNGKTAIVTFNRPEKLNALNTETLIELKEVLHSIESEQDLSVVILTGKGKAFIAGADVEEMVNKKPVEILPFARLHNELNRLIEYSPKITIAAINGYALGGGLETALACDIRVASEKAKFGQPEINLGIIPGAGGTQRLPRIIGYGNAMLLLTTGRIIDANEAKTLGLVQDVVPEGELMDRAILLADEIAKKPPVALAFIKDSVKRGRDMPLDLALEYEMRLFSILFSTEDQKEGMKAFIEKREPIFRGE